jgi:hypothetical protein
MRSEGFSFYFADLGVETCSLDAASGTATLRNRRQPSATVRNRQQPFAMMRALWPCLWRVLQKCSLLEISIVA